MVGRLAFTAAMVLAGSVMAGPKEDLEAGVRKLAGTSYAWKSVVERRRGEAPRAMVTLTREGKIDETGTMRMTETRSGVTGSTVASVEAVLKGSKGAVKTPDGWQSLSEVAAGRKQGREWFAVRSEARTLTGYQPVHEHALKLAEGAKLSASDGAIVGEMSRDAIIWTLGGEPPADAAKLSDLKGTVKFWIKDGVLVRFEMATQYTRTIAEDGFATKYNDARVVEIKDIGSTKLELPDEAKKKLE